MTANRPRRMPWVVAAVLAAGCGPAGAPERFPAEAAAQFAGRLKAQDADGTAAMYTEDAVLLPPDLPPVSGRAAIREFFARTNAGGSPGVELATVETLVLGDHAWRQGSFRLDGPGDGEPVTGKFVELWKKVDGRWLIHRDIWNSNAPPPAAAAADAASDEPA